MGVEMIIKKLKLTNAELLQEKNYPRLVDHMRRNHPECKETSYKRAARRHRFGITEDEKILQGGGLPGAGAWLAKQLNK